MWLRIRLALAGMVIGPIIKEADAQHTSSCFWYLLTLGVVGFQHVLRTKESSVDGASLRGRNNFFLGQTCKEREAGMSNKGTCDFHLTHMT